MIYINDKVIKTPVRAKDDYAIYGQLTYSLTSPGAGWYLCDGTNGAPDLQEMRLFGVGTLFTEHMLKRDEFAQHTHTGGTKASGSSNQFGGSNLYDSTTGYIRQPAYAQYVAKMGTSVNGNNTFSRSYTYYTNIWIYLG